MGVLKNTKLWGNLKYSIPFPPLKPFKIKMEILGLGVPDTQQFEPREAAAHCPSDIPAEPCRRNSCHDVNLWQASWLPEVRSGAINRPKQKPAVTSYLQSKSTRPECTSQSLSLFLSFLPSIPSICFLFLVPSIFYFF